MKKGKKLDKVKSRGRSKHGVAESRSTMSSNLGSFSPAARTLGDGVEEGTSTGKSRAMYDIFQATEGFYN